MWHNEEDLIKDLAYLNDFGNPSNNESYKILYLKGRGAKLKKKSEYPDTFLDSRTGETIKLDDINFDLYDNLPKRGKGRGSNLRITNKTKFQLQEQLRMARPLGSGDEAIESYCRRNMLVQTLSNTEENSSNIFFKTNGQTKNLPCQNEKSKQRVKATRNSSVQSNALIQSLLAKTKDSANDIGQRLDKSEGEVEEKEEILVDNSFAEIPEENDHVTDNLDEYVWKNFKITDDCNHLNNFLTSCSVCNEDSGAKKQSSSIKWNSSLYNEFNKDSVETYKRLGEKLDMFDTIQKSSFGESSNDFWKMKRHVSHVKSNNGENKEVKEKISTSQENIKGFVYDDEAFPPLQRN